MSSSVNRYQTDFEEAEILLKAAVQISSNMHGRQTSSREVEIVLATLNKIIGHVHALLRLAPLGPLRRGTLAQELWDISSMATLARAAVDAYYTMFYIAVDDIPRDSRIFRWLLWDHHYEIRRLKMLRLIGSQSKEISSIEDKIKNLKDKIVEHPDYHQNEPHIKKKLRNGDLVFIMDRAALSENAKIDVNYCRFVYRFLSQYTHAYPFALERLLSFRSGTDEGLRLISTVIRHSNLYLCCTLRDVIQFFPDQSPTLSNEVSRIIEIGTGVIREFSSFSIEEPAEW